MIPKRHWTPSATLHPTVNFSHTTSAMKLTYRIPGPEKQPMNSNHNPVIYLSVLIQCYCYYDTEFATYDLMINFNLPVRKGRAVQMWTNHKSCSDGQLVKRHQSPSQGTWCQLSIIHGHNHAQDTGVGEEGREGGKRRRRRRERGGGKDEKGRGSGERREGKSKRW